MSVVHYFACQFTKSKVKATPANAPTIDVADLAAPTAALLVSAASPTQLTNLTGFYVYAYTTSTLTVIPLANFHTDDATVDQQDLGSWPVVTLDANGNVLVNVAAYGANLDPATEILVTPSQKLATDADGLVGLRALDSPFVISGTLTTPIFANSATLVGSGISSVTDAYAGCVLFIVSGTGANQTPLSIIAYNGSTKVARFNMNFPTTPAAGDVFIILRTRYPDADSNLSVYASAVTTVTGNIGGKILGGGVGQISGVGVQASVEQWKGYVIPEPNVGGIPMVDLKYILGTVLTETAGQIAAAFTKFFNKAAPTGNVNSLPDAAPNAAGGLPISTAGALDLDEMNTDIEAIQTGVAAIPTTAAPTASQIDTQLSGTHGSGVWGSSGNGGTLSLVYTLTSDVDASPIDGAAVELYGNINMTGSPIQTHNTNALGIATFTDLVAGTYYLKRIKAGWAFTNPDIEVVA